MPGWACRQCGEQNVPGTRYCGYCGTLAAAPGPAPEERRLITSLFADLSGFTRLAEQLDAEQLLEVIDPIVNSLSEIVARFGGQVEKYAGDAVLALFGAPVAHDDDPERALLTALEMHRELARICASLPDDRSGLTLHVGVTSGHGIARMLGSAARMDYAVLGDSVILAQRLESAAPPGETYVGETTVRLTEHRFEFEDVGKLTLKGKAQPVPAWRLVGERAAEAPGGRLVGRQRELAALRRVVEDGGPVLVLGEPGLGKSRLVAEAQAFAEARGVRWLQGRCLSYGAALAYWPYVELLRGADDAPGSPYVRRLLGDGSDGVDVEPEAYRRALHDDVTGWLRRAAARQRVVLVLEDLHWSDEASLALTGEVAALAGSGTIGLVLVSRPEAAERVRAAAGEPSVELELGPLDAGQVAELLAAHLDDVPPGLAEQVHDRTGGNPFFAEEVARALRDHGARPDELPPTVEGVLAARIDGLPADAAGLLQTAAVIGRRVPLELLARVAGEQDVAGPVGTLVAASFFDPIADDRVAFHHALMQDAAYGRLLRRRRRELHLRVAGEAERLYGAGDEAVELLARHLYLGGAGAKAAEYLIRAGERARSLYANEEALVHFERARKVAPDDRAVTLSVAELRELVGDYDDALALYLDADAAAGGAEPAARRGAAATLRKQGRYEEALDLLGDPPPALELVVERIWTLNAAGRFEQAVEEARSALASAGDRRDAAVGLLLVRLARAEAVLGRTGAALAHALDAARLFEAEQDVYGLATALRVQGNAYAAVGRLDEAAAALRRGLETAERIGDAEEIGGCLLNLGLVELRRGHLDDALELDRRAVRQFERIAHGSGRAAAHGNLAEKLLAAGDLDEALAEGERALELAGAIGHTPTVADVERTLARVLLARGDAAAAAERAEAAAAAFRSLGADDEAAAALAEVAERAGR